MKERIKLLQAAMLFSCVGLALGLVYKVGSSVCSIRYVTFDFDERLSPMARSAIMHYVHECQSHGLYNAYAIVDEVPLYFSSVKSIAVQYLPLQTAHITIDGYDPLIRINDEQVLIENNAIITAANYGQFVLSNLYQLSLAGATPEKISSEITDSIKHAIHEKLFDHYTFHFANAQEWYLKDKEDPAFTLCCNSRSVPLGNIQKRYAQLKKEVLKKTDVKQKWMADVRFQNQIILSMSKGGHYGKGI